MTEKSIIYIAKKSYQARRRGYRGIVWSMGLSLTFLAITLFFSIAFALGTKSVFNKHHGISSITVSYSESSLGILAPDLEKMRYESSLDFDTYYITYDSYKEGLGMAFPDKIAYPTVSVGDKRIALDFDSLSKKGCRVMSFNKGDNLIFDSEVEYLSYLGAGEAIVGNASVGPGEIIISSVLARELGDDAESLIGQTLVYTPAKWESGNIVYEEDLFSLKIVGVFNAALYKCPTRVGHDQNDPLFWIPRGEDMFESDSSKLTFKIIQFRDFNDYLKGSAVLEGTKASAWPTDMNFALSRNTFAKDYEYTSPIFEIISGILAALGASVFLIGLIDIVNTLLYYSEKRRGFSAVTRAMGLKPGQAFRLSLYELAYSFVSAVLISAVITLAIAIPVTLAVNKGLGGQLSYVIPLRLELSAYPIAMAAVVLLVLAVCISVTFVIHKLEGRYELHRILSDTPEI